MAEVNIERYYLDYDKWMRLLEYIEEDGQIPEQEWDKYINYSYSRTKFIKNEIYFNTMQFMGRKIFSSYKLGY